MRVTRSSLSGGVPTFSGSKRGSKPQLQDSKGKGVAVRSSSAKRLSKSGTESESDHHDEEEDDDEADNAEDKGNESLADQSDEAHESDHEETDDDEAVDEGDFDSEPEDGDNEELPANPTRKKRQSSGKPVNRPAHMKKMGLSADILTTSDQMRLVSLARHRNILKPFVTDKVYNMLSTTLQKRGQDSVATDLKKSETISQPKTLVQCTMRSYQLEGLSWLVNNYNQRINCILGDEMGLGKTLQSISFVAYMLHVKKVSGPFLFVVPLTVLFNWMNEFRKWCPIINVLRVHTTDPTEQERLKSLIADPKTEVVVTTYEIIKAGGLSQVLRRVVWRSAFLDEGHRIRNEESNVARACCAIRAEFKVILTGTPLQNNLRETGGLLKFLAPNVFTDLTVFDHAFNLNVSNGGQATAGSDSAGAGSGLQIDRDLLNKAHYMMRPFLLRRIKSEVEQKLPPKIETKIDCPMTDMQKELTQFLLFRQRALLAKLEQRLKEKIAKEQQKQQALLLEQQREEQENVQQEAAGQLEGQEIVPMDLETTESNVVSSSAPLTLNKKKNRKRTSESTKLQDNSSNISASDTRGIQGLLAHLRKAANHPFLFEGIEKVNPDGTPTQEIITTSGKMIILDKLLTKLKEKGHRVVLFSQFTHTLDIICDYLEMRGHLYQRLDGSTNRVMREVRINLFNKPNSEYFIFALSTRAGGEGVNLYTADTVILFDSDWNPQVDIQAMARVHRIGQTKIVHVYRLVTKGSIDECIVHRAQKKLFLDSMVNRGSTSQALALDKQIQDEKKRKKLEQGDHEEGNTSKRQKLDEKDDEDTLDGDINEDDEDQEQEEKRNDEDNFDEEEDEMVNSTRLFTTLKFGWNSAFSAGPGDGKKPEEMISDADIENIIDRTRGLDGNNNTTSSTAGTITASDASVAVTSTAPAVDPSVSTSSDKNNNVDGKLKENQEISIDTFDEHVPLVKIDNIREQSLTDLENELKTTYEQGNKEALTTALGGGGVDDTNPDDDGEKNARGRPKRQIKARTEIVHVAGVGAVSVLRSSMGLSDLGGEGDKTNTGSSGKKKGKNILEGFRRRGDNSSANESSLNGGMVLPTSTSLRQVAGRDYQHQDMCQICWDGGEVLVCDGCPCSYHVECLGLKKVPGDFMWYCPHHSCATCHRKIQAAGLLFRCMHCQHAYCEDCLPAEAEIIGDCERFRDLGFRWPSNACYIKCSIDCIEFDPNAPPSDDDDEDEVPRNKKRKSKVNSSKEGQDGMEDGDDSNNDEKGQDDDVGEDDVTMDDQRQSKEGRDAPIDEANRGRYNPMSALTFCSLEDVKDRLSRDDYGINNRFLTLSEVPNFLVRFEKAPVIARLTIQLLVNFITKHDAKLELEEDQHLLENDANAAAAVEEEERPENAENKNQLESSMQSILNFSGISTKHSLPARARIFLAAVKILANTTTAALPQIAQVLGICHARHIRAPTKVEANMNFVGYKNEPKFNFPLNTRRRVLEESIAAFLVILSPQNLLLPGTGKTENPVKKDIAGVLYTTRCLQALGEPLYDSNSFYFTSYALRDVSDAGVREWILRYPSGKPADSNMKFRWMLPAVRLYMSMKSFLQHGFKVNDDSSVGTPVPVANTPTTPSPIPVETIKQRIKDWCDVDSEKLLKYLKYCETVVNKMKKELKIQRKNEKEAEEHPKPHSEMITGTSTDFNFNELMENAYRDIHSVDEGMNHDDPMFESVGDQSPMIQQQQQQQQQPQVTAYLSNAANLMMLQQQHQQQGQQFVGNQVILPSIPSLPPQLQQMIPSTQLNLNPNATEMERTRLHHYMEHQRSIMRQKDEQKQMRIEREEGRLRQEIALPAMQLQRQQEALGAHHHNVMNIMNTAQTQSSSSSSNVAGPIITHTAVDLSNPVDLSSHISAIQETKLMYDWLVSVHNVLQKFAATPSAFKMMIGLEHQVDNHANMNMNGGSVSTHYAQSEAVQAMLRQRAEPSSSMTTRSGDGWRLNMTTQQRQRIIEALSILLDKLESILYIRSHAEKCRKLQLYELALLSIAQSAEDYLTESTIPQRLAVMLASFQKYVVDAVNLNPSLMQEIQHQLMIQHEEAQQRMLAQAQLFQRQRYQQIALSQIFFNHRK